MSPRPIQPARPCSACCALDGCESTAAAHEAVEHERSTPIEPDDPDAGVVEYYRCRTCGVQLQRFGRACALDGWLVVRARPALLLV